MAKKHVKKLQELAGFKYLNIPFMSMMNLTNKTFVITKMELIEPNKTQGYENESVRMTIYIESEDDIYQTISGSYLFRNLYEITGQGAELPIEVTLKTIGKDYILE